MITYKVKYKRYIVNLYVPEQRSGQVVLLLPGLPMSTNINNILKPFLDAGAVVFYPYFSGSYDSGGTFSAEQSVRDVAALYELTQLSKVTELYFGKEVELGVPKKVVLVGMSYGAVIALLGHKNLYQKIILLSPALLFNPVDIGGEAGVSFHEQMKSLLHLLKSAHPFTYRTGFAVKMKQFLLGRGHQIQYRSILDSLNEIQCPSLILHGEHDTSVPVQVTRFLEQETSNRNITWHYIDSGHSTSSYNDESLARIRNFIET
jgi:pimeloyl-ACP methyl ester carboxylesterase